MSNLTVGALVHDFFLDYLGPIIFFPLLIEGVAFKGGRIHGDRAVIAELVNHRMIVQGPNADPMALRAFQEHARQSEQRIGNVP